MRRPCPTYRYELPSVPDYRIEVPLVPTYSPPQRRVDPRDYMQQFTTPQEIKRQFERMDRPSERRRWAECAKYNRHCVNMLRSLGGR
ncbi:MAG: hypothetical protein OXK81_04545 [Chloroflexota bacterium]|nr:hypothetical protein [Chloroflexota bacterium]